MNIFDIEYFTDFDVGSLTTMKIPALSKAVFFPKNQNELIYLYDYFSSKKYPFIILGNGSNVIFTKKAENFIVISTKKVKNYIKNTKNIISLSSSTMLPKLYRYCQERGLSGFEKFGTIPATIGGAIYMNAGCFGENISDRLLSIKVRHNGKTLYLKKENIDFDYRKSGLHDYLILSAKFLCEIKDKCQIEQDYKKYLSLRIEKQPRGLSSGSFFKNTPNFFAGKIIDECGLKGFQYGGAKISEKHGNFILNYSNATSEDILELIKIIKNKVYQKFSVNLEEEVQIF